MGRAGDGMGQDGHSGGFYSPSPSIRAEHKAAQMPSCSVLVKAQGEGGSLEGVRSRQALPWGRGLACKSIQHGV